MNKYSFGDIPQYTRWSNYCVNIPWKYLEIQLKHHTEDYNLNLDPDFQRAHVWTELQQIRFVEFVLRGGHSGMDLLFNCVNWNTGEFGEYVLVDGKQRLEAVRRFMRNELAIFADGLLGNKKPVRLEDFTEHGPSMTHCSFRWNVNDLNTRAEVLTWYLEINSGGVVHTEDELSRVRALLKEEQNTKV